MFDTMSISGAVVGYLQACSRVAPLPSVERPTGLRKDTPIKYVMDPIESRVTCIYKMEKIRVLSL
jgi:hypothetical protein